MKKLVFISASMIILFLTEVFFGQLVNAQPFSSDQYTQFEKSFYQIPAPFIQNSDQQGSGYDQWVKSEPLTPAIKKPAMRSQVNQSHSWIQQAGDGRELVVSQNHGLVYNPYTAKPQINQYDHRNYAQPIAEKDDEIKKNIKPIAEIVQYGMDNKAVQSIFVVKDGNFLEQLNLGGEITNFADEEFRGNESGYLFIEQIGIGNYASQEILNNNESYTLQQGNFNQAKVEVSNGEDNYSYMLQFDNDNTIKIWQDSEHQTINIVQKEGENIASSVQSGKSNSVELMQTKGSKVNLSQFGENNSIHGYGSSWSESLNGSILDIQQAGNENNILIHQKRSMANILQKGMENKSIVIQK